jgi:hypothetical protein
VTGILELGANLTVMPVETARTSVDGVTTGPGEGSGVGAGLGPGVTVGVGDGAGSGVGADGVYAALAALGTESPTPLVATTLKW